MPSKVSGQLLDQSKFRPKAEVFFPVLVSQANAKRKETSANRGFYIQFSYQTTSLPVKFHEIPSSFDVTGHLTCLVFLALKSKHPFQIALIKSILSLSTHFKLLAFNNCVAMLCKVRVRTCNNHSKKTPV